MTPRDVLHTKKAVLPRGFSPTNQHRFSLRCSHHIEYMGDGEWTFLGNTRAAIVAVAMMEKQYICRCALLYSQMSALESDRRVMSYHLGYDGSSLEIALCLSS